MAKQKIYLKITNKNEIDINAFKLLGISVKEGEGKIGYFGTGLKYAMAVLLRNDIAFKIFSGNKEIKITTKGTKFRGKNFKIIKINNNLTSLTTDMGKDWKLWFAIREIYCNAIDEGKYELTVSNKCNSKKGQTTFYIEFNDKLKEIFSNWNLYFSGKRKDIVFNENNNKLFQGDDNLLIYRKGIQVYEEKNKKCLYHYDLDQMEINESRTIPSMWSFSYDLVQFLGIFADENIIRNIYDNYENTFEGKLDWSNCYQFNKNWLNILGGRIIILKDVAGYFTDEMDDKTIILPNSLAQSLKQFFGKQIKIKGQSDKYGEKQIIPINNRQNYLLNECLDFLKRTNFNVGYKIKICEFENEKCLGQGTDNTIFLSPKLFDLGRKEIVATIIEEYFHLKSMANDKTRDFQDYLIMRYISLLENKINVYL